MKKSLHSKKEQAKLSIARKSINKDLVLVMECLHAEFYQLCRNQRTREYADTLLSPEIAIENLQRQLPAIQQSDLPEVTSGESIDQSPHIWLNLRTQLNLFLTKQCTKRGMTWQSFPLQQISQEYLLLWSIIEHTYKLGTVTSAGITSKIWFGNFSSFLLLHGLLAFLYKIHTWNFLGEHTHFCHCFSIWMPNNFLPPAVICSNEL